MKRAFTSILLLGSGVAMLAAGEVQQLDEKAQRILAKFDSMQITEHRVPADILKKAQGIVLLDRTKGAFIVGYEGGGGIAMARDAKDKWGPISFMSAGEGSLGFQIGGQQSFMVVVILTKDAASRLSGAVFDFGGEARGTAGDQSSGTEGKVSSDERPVMVYDSREGLFGGAAIKGGKVSPDDGANEKYYGKVLSARQVLSGEGIKPTKAAEEFVEKIDKYSKK
jgi:lipid-binding SYLF domain-containing protein